MAIGKHIGEKLKEQNKTAAWLSRETKIPATTIRTWITKDKDSISFVNLEAIAVALKCPFADLLPEVPVQAAEFDWWRRTKYQLLDSLFTLSNVDYDKTPFDDRYYLMSNSGQKLQLSIEDENRILEKITSYFEFEANKLIKELDERDNQQ